MARVSEAADAERICVVKRLLPELARDPEMVSLFLDEARINLLLDHPNILPIHDMGRMGDEVFLVMEHVEGHDLRWLLGAARRARSRIPRTMALFIAAEVLEALGHAHQARSADGRPMRLVHRDVSPENVLLSREGAVLLGDFGAARATVSRSRLQPGTALGKLAYMAPETLERGEATASADLFAVGLILVEMLAGEALQRAESAQGAFRFWQEFDPTRAIPRMVPLSEGGAVLIKALEIDPARRYPDAGAFAADIRELLFRRGRRVGPGDLARLLRRIEGSAEESGRVITAPVDLPLASGGNEQAVTVDDEPAQVYVVAGTVTDGPVARSRAREILAQHDPGDGLIHQAGASWRPADPARLRGSRPWCQRLTCERLGSELLAGAEAGRRTRYDIWLRDQLVRFTVGDGQLLEATHVSPGSGPPRRMDPLAWMRPRGDDAGGGPATLVATGLVDTSHAEVLVRRELCRYLAIPLGWDEMWFVSASAEAPSGERPVGVVLLRVLADAARRTGSHERLATILTRAAEGGMRVSRTARSGSAAAALWPVERQILDAIAGGARLLQLVQRHQVDPPRLFGALFVLAQTGLVRFVDP